jgi:EPS-associated MarR family transcriptional regulator
MKQPESEFTILRLLENNPNITQRQISKKLGLSLGKTNYVIAALINKGWVKLNNFKHSNNKLGYAYLLTQEGVTEKTNLTQKFIRIKSDEYNSLKKEIEILKKQL